MIIRCLNQDGQDEWMARIKQILNRDGGEERMTRIRKCGRHGPMLPEESSTSEFCSTEVDQQPSLKIAAALSEL
jgi:hypothetical protein